MSNDPLYREIILEHWQNPQNYGEIKNPDLDISDSNPLCGDEIRITAKIENGKVTDIKFMAVGCAISKASASIFTQKIKNQSIENIKEFTSEDLLKDLEINLTPARLKCALLVYSTFQRGLRSK